MSLSDGERFDQIVSILDSFAQIKPFKRSYGHVDLAKLNPLLRSLYPTFLGKSSNGMAWISGTELVQDHLGETSLVKSVFSNAEALEQDRERSNSLRDSRSVEDHMALEYRSTYLPGAEKFLSTDSSQHDRQVDVYNMWLLCDAYYYATNRYDDGLSRKLRRLTNVVSSIKGILAQEFARNLSYYKAWMAGHLMDKFYTYDEADWINAWYRTENMHHYARLPDDFKTLKDLFCKYQFVITLSDEQRLFGLLFFTGSGYHYEHQHKKLTDLVVKHNKEKRNKKNQIDLVAVEKACKDRFDANAAKSVTPYERYCHLTGQTSRK